MGKKDNREWATTDSEEGETSLLTVVEDTPPTKPKIPFAHWFDKKLNEGLVRFYQDDTILIFFKEQGLTELEDEDEYEKSFKKF